MQAALTREHKGCVRVTHEVRKQLNTFSCLLHMGACDATKTGAGGVWFPDTGPPLLWRLPFAEDIQRRLMSWEDPTGGITNSDLELAGTILHQDVLGIAHDLTSKTAHTFCDNIPAVFHLKGLFFGVWRNFVVRGTEFLQFGLLIRYFWVRNSVVSWENSVVFSEAPVVLLYVEVTNSVVLMWSRTNRAKNSVVLIKELYN
jgi:hypothetical protein